MGAHILGIKDMAGLLKPTAAYELVTALRQEIDLLIHLHAHDTSGINAASLLRAAEAGTDIVDGAVASLSGQTSQPNLNSLVAALRHTPRDSRLDGEALDDCSRYWETVRSYYLPFDNGPRAGSAAVYQHEIPGGQYTNLQQQASAMGLAHRWHEVERMYGRVNQLFGDIVKVTPSSKVVGDMALFLLVKSMTPEDVLALPQDHDIAFSDSVADMFAGSLGTSPGGWPLKVQEIILRRREPLEGRPGAKLPPADLQAVQAQLSSDLQREARRDECLSYLLYPKVFLDFAETWQQYSDVSVLPTPTFLYGMKVGDEIAIHIEVGKTLIVKFLTVCDPHPDGTRTVFFELNGQPRRVDVRDHSLTVETHTQRKAEAGNPNHVGAPTPGLVTGLFVQVGAKVKCNDKLISLEAMKMQSTLYAPTDGIVSEVLVQPGQQVDAKDLCLVLE